MNLLMRIGKWIGVLVGCCAILIVGFLAIQWWRAEQAQAVYVADVEVADLAGSVTITRDQWGVPYIEAESETDALYALGFVHAQDRLWQMDLVRRAASGRMSELFGALTLGYDAYMRHWQFPKLVDESWQAFRADDKARVEAYAAGINAYLASSVFRKTPEHIWLMAQMEPWAPTDSLLVAKMLWPNLSTNLFEEFTRAQLAHAVSPDFAKAFIRPYPKDSHVAMAWPDLARTLGLPVETPHSTRSLNLNALPDRDNSNNWVVAGGRSRSGAPMLANDPHLGLTMPGFWYLAHMRYPGAVAAGGTIAGMPAIVVGHNTHLSWGTTNAHDSDVQDVYREELKAGDPRSYRTKDGWAAFAVRQETIKVRFSDDVQRSYRSTRRGPVLEQDALPIAVPREEGYEYSLKWTALDGADLTLSAIMAVSRARSAKAFRNAANDFSGPPQNIVFSHQDGDIGLVVAGLVPKRSKQHQTKGASPSDGWRAENHWQGLIPPELTPYVLNPASGSLVTANARVVPPQYPFFRSADASDPSRQDRIAGLIAAQERHDMASFAAIQTDTRAPVIQSLLPALLKTETLDDASDQALTFLRDWNGDWAAAGPAPVIFAQWVSFLTQALMWDELGDSASQFSRINLRRLAAILNGPLAAWCDDQSTPLVREECALMLSRTLAATAEALVNQHGTLAQLEWGAIHRDTHSHLGLGALPILGDVLGRETYRLAGPDAPNVAGLRANTLPAVAGGGFGPSLRFVIDMATPQGAQFMISSGQSGHFASPHYDDLQGLWAKGETIALKPPGDRQAKMLRLSPALAD